MRERLPDRRVGDTLTLRCQRLGNRTIHVTRGYYPDGRLGEIFIYGLKIGSDLDSILREFATSVSINLQCGVPLAELADSMQREQSGLPCTPQGEILDALTGRQG